MKRSLAGAAGIVVLLATGCGELGLQRSAGEKLFRQNCAECHGIDGAGKVPKYRQYEAANLLDEYWKFGGDPVSLEQLIRAGSFPMMPAFDQLSATEMKDLLAHIRELRGGD